jgi:hypothetical protein
VPTPVWSAIFQCTALSKFAKLGAVMQNMHAQVGCHRRCRNTRARSFQSTTRIPTSSRYSRPPATIITACSPVSARIMDNGVTPPDLAGPPSGRTRPYCASERSSGVGVLCAAIVLLLPQIARPLGPLSPETADWRVSDSHTAIPSDRLPNWRELLNSALGRTDTFGNWPDAEFQAMTHLVPPALKSGLSARDLRATTRAYCW